MPGSRVASNADKLPAGHFTDPLDTPLAAIFRQGLSAAGTVVEVFKAAGFGTGEDDGDRELQAMVAQHLARSATAASALRGKR